MVSPLSVWAGLMRYTTSRRKWKSTGNGYLKILCAHIRETTTHKAYRPRNADSAEIKPTIEIQSILDLLFVEAQGQEIYKGLYVNLEGADLQGAIFIRADLQKANLWEAKLQNAYLWGANLQGAHLWNANLQNAYLWDAKLQKADLWYADLQKADLREANLQGADLCNADLTGAINLKVEQLLKVRTLYKAKLPVGMEEKIRKENSKLIEDPDA